jgi:hypothetical protein
VRSKRRLVDGIDAAHCRVRSLYSRPGFGTYGLRLDNLRDGVNQLLVLVQRRGETASGKPRRGARMALQAGLGSKRRDAEVPKTRPVARLRAEKGINGRAGIVAGNRIGSPTQTKGVLHGGDTSEVIDSEWPTETFCRLRVGGVCGHVERSCAPSDTAASLKLWHDERRVMPDRRTIFRVAALVMLLLTGVELFACEMMFPNGCETLGEQGSQQGQPDDCCLCCCTHVVAAQPIPVDRLQTVVAPLVASEPGTPETRPSRIYHPPRN